MTLRERQSHLVTEAELRSLASAARAASRVVAKAPAQQRHAALVAIAAAVRAQAPTILAANQRDLDGAAARGLAPAMIDRLRLDERRLAAIAAAVDEIAAQPELVGRLEREETRPNGLRIARMRIPLGVIAIVYEARPNVTVDAAALCLKAGNACILRGGSEAFHSNQALGGAVAAGLEAAGCRRRPAATIIVPSTDREAAIILLLGLDDSIDLCIPRGGEGLIRFVAEHARVPVIKHYKGVCHLYVHAAADLAMALAIADNGKTSRPGVCNALETILSIPLSPRSRCRRCARGWAARASIFGGRTPRCSGWVGPTCAPPPRRTGTRPRPPS